MCNFFAELQYDVCGVLCMRKNQKKKLILYIHIFFLKRTYNKRQRALHVVVNGLTTCTVCCQKHIATATCFERCPKRFHKMQHVLSKAETFNDDMGFDNVHCMLSNPFTMHIALLKGFFHVV